jgi:hypothetical protein
MVTATEEWAWDMFLDEDDPARPHVVRFREDNWATIRRELNQLLVGDGLTLTVGHEPNWAETGKAAYWRRLDGIYAAMTGKVAGDWEPTLPLPANNAHQVYHYLQKGFRLRPDKSSLCDVDGVEATMPAGGDEEGPSYDCKRHGPGTVEFSTWRGYRQHCLYHKETLQHGAPDERMLEILESGDKFYCIIHDRTFNTERAAQQHAQTFVTRRLRYEDYLPHHPNLDAMRIDREEKDNDANADKGPTGGGKPVAEGAAGGAKGKHDGVGKAR